MCIDLTFFQSKGLMLMNTRKSLILFRHAKSDWDADYSSDHKRPLADRGEKAARTMGTLLKDSKKLPELVVCSTATRARQTVDLAATEGHWNLNIEYSDYLYECSPDMMINLLQQMENSVRSIMLVGHEPTWSSLASLLIGGGNIRFPTAAMARIDFYFNDWRSIGGGTGQLRWLLQPRFFKSK